MRAASPARSSAQKSSPFKRERACLYANTPSEAHSSRTVAARERARYAQIFHRRVIQSSFIAGASDGKYANDHCRIGKRQSVTPNATPGGVTIVTQTRVRAGRDDEFSERQKRVSAAASEFPGFIEQTVMPPNAPAQIDWIILQRFASLEGATSWLNSKERLDIIEDALPMLVGQDDVHIVHDDGVGVLPSPASALIATKLKPGVEAQYQAWEQKVATVQSKAIGFQGFRFEPPIPGVQDSWLTILRFDSDVNLQAWLKSPERVTLLKEAEPFTEEHHARIVRTGFDQWFKVAEGAPPPAVWKMNMLVLMVLYPLVFLFGVLVQTPLMTNNGVPYWLALFVSQIFSVLVLNWLVARSARRFKWWLSPHSPSVARINVIGAGVVIGIYAVCLLLFGVYSTWVAR
jgi:antibiotic biosynthesis monooxygenase (ABM) superfamily enzyme